MALLSFAQSLFLVFAAVYIAKESIEQVILGSAAHEHAVGGSHGHGEAIIDGDERSVHLLPVDGAQLTLYSPFPHFLLLCAAVTSICSGGVPGNHSKLVAGGCLTLYLRCFELTEGSAVGPLFLPARFIALPIVETFAPLLANPFTLTVAGSSAGILLGSIIVPP